MRLSSSTTLDLLAEKPGRYIHHDAGSYRMKEANGEDVKLTQDGKEYSVEPPSLLMDGLMDENRLVCDRSNYALPSNL